MIVCKFGGSTVDGAAGIARVAAILRSRLAARPVVVVSAMAKTTRRLLDSAEAAAAGNLAAALAGCEELYAFHRGEGEMAVPGARRPELVAALDRSFGELRGLLVRLAGERRLTPRDADAAAAWGEVMASEILAMALPGLGVPAAWIDARRVIVTDDAFTRARPLDEETGERLRQALLPAVERGAVPVVGGYIGATRDGIVTTLGKEGSDYSAAIVGAALGAEEIQIWTDVDGILTADPRLVPGARLVRSLSFAESLELACSGTKKPHHGTLGPAARAGVPIRILNARDHHGGGGQAGGGRDAGGGGGHDAGGGGGHDAGGGGDGSDDGEGKGAERQERGRGGIDSDLPGSVRGGGKGGEGEGAEGGGTGGTVIGARDATAAPAVRSLAWRPNDCLLRVSRGRSSEEDLARRVLAAVERMRPALLLLQLDGEGADLALDHGDRLAEAREELGAAGAIGVLRGRAVVSVVSEDLAGDGELAARVLAAARDYQPRLVVAGAAAPVVRCLVEIEDLPAIVNELHRRLFEAAGD